jgi:hypothetical protein
LNTGLWGINLRPDKPHPSIAAANTVYDLRNTGTLVNCLYKAILSSTKYALLQAVKKGHLTTWSVLTEQAINKHFKMTPATAMGHMKQWSQNIHSTSKTTITSDLEDETVTPAGLGEKTHLVYAVVIDQGQLYTDLMGRFTVRSSKGNWYVMVCYYSYDCNLVKPVPMKSRSAFEWLKTYGVINKELT